MLPTALLPDFANCPYSLCLPSFYSLSLPPPPPPQKGTSILYLSHCVVLSHHLLPHDKQPQSLVAWLGSSCTGSLTWLNLTVIEVGVIFWLLGSHTQPRLLEQQNLSTQRHEVAGLGFLVKWQSQSVCSSYLTVASFIVSENSRD